MENVQVKNAINKYFFKAFINNSYFEDLLEIKIDFFKL